MKIDRTEAARIAELARLEFDEAGLEAMAVEMTGILDYIDQLREVEVAGFEQDDALPAPMRDDEPRQPLERDAVRANAPAWRDGFFVVPKVLGSD